MNLEEGCCQLNVCMCAFHRQAQRRTGSYRERLRRLKSGFGTVKRDCVYSCRECEGTFDWRLEKC